MDYVKILNMGYDRDKYLQVIKAELEPNIVKHSLALEACMGGIYDYLERRGELGVDEPFRDDWVLAGLVHDVDFGGKYKEKHPYKTVEVLAEHGLEIPDVVDDIVKAHTGKVRGKQIALKAHWAIFCADSLTGLIIAVALVYPSKKLADVKLKSVVKRFKKEPRFAAGTRRDEVAMCEREDGLNMPVEKFIEICLESLKGVSEDLEL